VSDTTTHTRTLVVASTNTHKVAEIAAMLASEPGLSTPHLRVIGLDRRDELPEVEEDQPDFVGNAVLKAEAFARHFAAMSGLRAGDLVLADDSGIVVDALGGAPGVRSARYAGPGATDADNNAAVIAALREVGLDASSAHYECALALTRVGGGKVPRRANPTPGIEHREVGDTLVVIGRCDGEFRALARGSGGFGYDPHFWIDGGERTMAELTREAKAARSHRGAALRGLVEVAALLGGHT